MPQFEPRRLIAPVGRKACNRMGSSVGAKTECDLPGRTDLPRRERTTSEASSKLVQMHYLMPGLRVLEARDVSHRWVVFHDTYDFALIDWQSNYPVISAPVEWRYRHRTYALDPHHVTMLMQPGELHANVRPNPLGRFIVVHVDIRLMNDVAQALGWRHAQALNVGRPDACDPAIRGALVAFRDGLCAGASSRGSHHCMCWSDPLRHAENLVSLLNAFLEKAAERAHPVVLPECAPSILRRAVEFLKHHEGSYSLADLATAAGCAKNPFYLLHVFKREMSISPGEFHRKVALSRTCRELLRRPHTPLEVLTAEWPSCGEGSSHVNAFIKAFRRTWCTTPDRYRSQLRGIPPAEWHRNAMRALRLVVTNGIASQAPHLGQTLPGK